MRPLTARERFWKGLSFQLLRAYLWAGRRGGATLSAAAIDSDGTRHPL